MGEEDGEVEMDKEEEVEMVEEVGGDGEGGEGEEVGGDGGGGEGGGSGCRVAQRK